MGTNVAPSVSTILQNMVSSGFCTPNDLSEKVMAKVQMLSEQEAIMALNELSSVPRETIRNFPSYMMGILNRYMRGESGANASKQGQNRQQQHSRGSRPERPRTNGDRYGRRSSRSSSPGERRHRHRRHRSRSPSSDRDYHRRSRRDRSTSRSRSRDRYDDRGRDRRRRSRSQSPRYRRDDRYDHDSRRGSQTMNVNPSGTKMVQQFGIPPPPPPPPHFASQQHIQPSQMHHVQQQPIMQMHQHQQPIWSNLGGQAPPAQIFNAPASAPSYSANPASEVNGLPVIDILGIAERAAAAIGSMSGATTRLNPTSDPRDPRAQLSTNVDPRQNVSQSMYAPQISSVQPQNSSTQRQEQYNDTRDDVKISDLSPMLQYSISNLVSTGHLDINPGGNVCRLLKSMPEPLSLGCLEKFSGIDSSTMRSKEGYLVGILKKAQANGRVV